jgi:RNA recognition motif-containing protein
MMTTLKVDNISNRTGFVFMQLFSYYFVKSLFLCDSSVDVLKEVFSKYGEVGDVYIPRNFSTNEPKGFAFVRFPNRSDAEEAMRSMEGGEIEGRVISIQEAKEKRAENPRETMRERYGSLVYNDLPYRIADPFN